MEIAETCPKGFAVEAKMLYNGRDESPDDKDIEEEPPCMIFRC